MKVIRMTALAAALLLGASALAQTKEHKAIKIVVDADDAGNYTSLAFDSEQMGFDLSELQEGESRSFVDDKGRNVLVTRESDGFKIDVDGEIIALPAIDFAIEHGDHATATWVGDVDVEVEHDSMALVDADSVGVMIISSDPIDASTQETIRSVLQSAGHSGRRALHRQERSRAWHTRQGHPQEDREDALIFCLQVRP